MLALELLLLPRIVTFFIQQAMLHGHECECLLWSDTSNIKMKDVYIGSNMDTSTRIC